MQKSDSQRQKDKKQILSFLVHICLLVLLVYIVFFCVFRFVRVTGDYMFPALRDGDLVLAYSLEKEYDTGDILALKVDGEIRFGRVIARGGDVIAFTGEGQVLINDNPLTEDIFYPTYPRENWDAYVVPEGEYYLLGDRRTSTIDSRDYGSVKPEEVIGKVFTVIRRRGF